MNLKNHGVRRRHAKQQAKEQRQRDNGRALFVQEMHRKARLHAARAAAAAK